MAEWLLPYDLTVYAFGAMGGLLLLQVLVSDAVSIAGRHPPGVPVAPDHASLLVRVHRAHANTNETLAGFVLLALFAVASAADPAWLNGCSAAYVASRVAHMACYYAGWKLMRSVSFGLSLVALVGILVVGLMA
jgi:uncharacterized MAPEG superfamily protein